MPNKRKELPRGAGILLPVSSLPSPYGIGALGKAAFAFIDFLKEAGQKYWQVLPVGPTSSKPGPILFRQETTAVKLVIMPKLSREITKKEIAAVKK